MDDSKGTRSSAICGSMTSPRRSRTSIEWLKSPRHTTITPICSIHGWNKVKLSLTNHAAGGLTEIDFDMAARFDCSYLGQTAA